MMCWATWFAAGSVCRCVRNTLPQSVQCNCRLHNWAALCVYTEDGWLDIANNEGENSLRGLCLGRKN
jgi:hypothetical protein